MVSARSESVYVVNQLGYTLVVIKRPMVMIECNRGHEECSIQLRRFFDPSKSGDKSDGA